MKKQNYENFKPIQSKRIENLLKTRNPKAVFLNNFVFRRLNEKKKHEYSMHCQWIKVFNTIISLIKPKNREI